MRTTRVFVISSETVEKRTISAPRPPSKVRSSATRRSRAPHDENRVVCPVKISQGVEKSKKPSFFTVFRPPTTVFRFPTGPPRAHSQAARTESNYDPRQHCLQVSSISAQPLGFKTAPESEKFLRVDVTSLVGHRPSIADISRNPRCRMMPFDRHARKVSINIRAKFHVCPSPSSRSSKLRKNNFSPRSALSAAKFAAYCVVLENRLSSSIQLQA
jgi:hypothetical protein